MGARLTFGLMIVAAVTLVVGYFTRTAAVIYLSIGCSLIAVIGLLLSARRKSATQPEDAETWTRSLADTTDTATNPVVATKARGRRAKSGDTYMADVPEASADADDDEDSEANKAYEELLASTGAGRRTHEADDTDPGRSRSPRRRGGTMTGSRRARSWDEEEADAGFGGRDATDDGEDIGEALDLRDLPPRRSSAGQRPARAPVSRSGGPSATARMPRFGDDEVDDDAEDTRVLSRTSPRGPRRSDGPSGRADGPGSVGSTDWSAGADGPPVPPARPASASARSSVRRTGGPGGPGGSGPADDDRPPRRRPRIDGPGGPDPAGDDRPARRPRPDGPGDDRRARRPRPDGPGGPDPAGDDRPARRPRPDGPDDQRPTRRPRLDASDVERPARRPRLDGPGGPGPAGPADVERPARRRPRLDGPDDDRSPRSGGPAGSPAIERPSRRAGAPGLAVSAAGATAAAADRPPSREPAGREPPRSESSRRKPAPPSQYPFPIEDYDDLDVEEILPLLPQLYDEELVEVFVHERDGAHRRAILDRLDSLLEGN